MFAILNIWFGIHCVLWFIAVMFKLANRLRVARAEKRLTQEDLARMAGVTRQTIGAIENEQYCPSALLAFVLAEQLEKPVAELFYLDKQEEP